MTRELFDLSAKRAVIVGGAGEIGLAIAKGFLDLGASVAAIDIKSNPTSPSLKNESYFEITADIMNRNEIDSSLDVARNCLDGTIDILVNAAGIQKRNSSENFSISDWDQVIAVNLTSVFLYSQKAAKDMLQKGSGKIINIASIMSNFGGITIPAYSASKGGVAQLTRAMSNDLAGRGICINAIAPGYIKTSLNSELIRNEKRTKEILERTPLGRWGEPGDLVGISIFLASRASDFLTGTIIPVDGGYSAR